MKNFIFAAALLAGILTFGCGKPDTVFTKDSIQVMTEVASVVACKKVTYKIDLPASNKKSTLALTLYDSQLTTNNASENVTLAKECARRLLANLNRPEQFQYVAVSFALSGKNASERTMETYRFSTGSL
jgi:hypothetical protein